VEILAIAIRNQENIKGITIAGLETKLLQFADDTTTVPSDLDSARALLGLLERFEKTVWNENRSNVDWVTSGL